MQKRLFYVCDKPLVVKHHDSSELGFGRQAPSPPWPFLMNLEWKDKCDNDYGLLLNQILDYLALLSIYRNFDSERLPEVGRLLVQYPITRKFMFGFLKMRLKYKWQIRFKRTDLKSREM
jgi:hypothetical protein